MTNDLEARVVQAARRAVAKLEADRWPEVVADLLDGRYDDEPLVRFAILGARAALAEIERDGGWREIDENTPRDGRPVLVSDGKAIICARNFCFARHIRGDDMWVSFEATSSAGGASWHEVVEIFPTHWQPIALPAAPTSHPQSADQTEQA